MTTDDESPIRLSEIDPRAAYIKPADAKSSVSELVERVTKAGWQTIDTAPKEEWFLGWCGWHIVVKWFDDGERVKGGFSDDADGVNPVFMLTHWQSLPVPPGETDDNIRLLLSALADAERERDALSAKLAEALALVPGEPVAWQWRQSYVGTWGNWNECGLLAADQQKWIDLAKKLPNEVQVRPLYTSPARHLSVDREGPLEEAKRVLELVEGRLSLLLSAYPDESETCDHPIATRYVRERVVAFLSKLEASSNAV